MKEIKLTIPEYLSIGNHQRLTRAVEKEPLSQMVEAVVSLTHYTEKQVKSWPIKTIHQAAIALSEVIKADNEFFPLVQFQGELYGYASLSKASGGEFIDLQKLLNNPTENLHQIAAMLYRPVVRHKFKDLQFISRYASKLVNNKVDNPFNWYTIEKYDSEVREERSEIMKEFPVQLILGAMGFTLVTGGLSLNDTLYSENLLTKEKMEMDSKKMLEVLSQSIGGGSALYTALASPQYLTSQETLQ